MLKNQRPKFTLEIRNLKRVALLSIYMNISTSETALKTCVNEISNLVLNFSLVMNILPCEQTAGQMLQAPRHASHILSLYLYIRLMTGPSKFKCLATKQVMFAPN